MTARRLVLMRHGEPEWGRLGRAGRLIGHQDAVPSPDGIALCVARAALVAPACVVSSDLARAAVPAGAIARAAGLVLRVDPRWRELDFGAWDGADPAALPVDDLARFHADPDAAPPPGGERWSALTVRVGAALAGLADGTLVVAHAGSIRAALAGLLGLDHRQVWGIALPYGALLTVDVWPGPAPAGQITGLVT